MGRRLVISCFKRACLVPSAGLCGDTEPAGKLWCARNKHWVQREQFEVKNAATGELYKQCDPCRVKVSTPSGAQVGMMQMQADLEQVKTQVSDHDGRLRALEELDQQMMPGADEKDADVAEWFRLKHPEDDATTGDVVELLDGTISRTITGTGLVFVLSMRPMFVGNRPSEADDERSGRAVVLLGQEPVRALGAVKAGQALVPCGDSAATVSVGGEYTGHCKIIALESSSDDATTVRCLVSTGAADGTIANAPEEIRSELEALCTKVRELETRLGDDGSSWVYALKHDDESVSDVTGESPSPPFVVSSAGRKLATAGPEPSDLTSLAEAHPFVRALLDDSAAVKEKNTTMLSTMRRWMREPAARDLQRALRGFLGRRRAIRDHACAFRAATCLQAAARRISTLARFTKTRDATILVQAHVRRRRAIANLAAARKAETLLARATCKVIALRHFRAVRLAALAIQTRARALRSRFIYRAVRTSAIVITSLSGGAIVS